MAAREISATELQAAYDNQAGLEEFRLEMLHTVIPAVIVLTVGYDLWLAAEPNQIPPQSWPLDLGLIAVVAASALLLRRGLTPAGLMLNSGLAAAIVAIAYLHPGYPVLCGLALLVMLITALHGSQVGLGSAFLFTGVIIYLQSSPSFAVSPATAGIAIVLVWLGAGLAWLSTRPAELALHWAWFSYVQELKALEVVRERQAELARLNRSLSDACKQLEAANEELDRARRAAVKARRLRDRFAATVSHEMRTPLNLIIGFSEVMVETPEVYYGEKLPASYQEDLVAIYRNACHLSQLVNDILDLAQIEANHLPLEKVPCAVAEIIDEAVLATKGLFQTKGLALCNTVLANLPLVLADRTRIRQIIINLLSNAARFTRVGGITIEASELDHEILVRVRDTGDGIPKEYIQQIFEEFSQAETPLRRDIGGTGLGLTISKRLIELHGGNLWAESNLGEGSTFSFSLPKQINVASGTVRPDWDTWIRVDGNGERAPAVLLLTNDDFSTQLIQRYVEGYRIVPATTYQHARRIARQAHPVAAITIGTNAEEWCLHRDHARVLGDIPTISCVAGGLHAVQRDLGVHAYLTKPLTRARLRAALRDIPRDSGSCLIVDDDPEITRLFRHFIATLRTGWEVRMANGGAEALEVLRTWRPGLILLDLLMPGVDGYRVLQAVQADERLRGIPVIVVSAKGLADERFRATEITIRSSQGIAAGEIVRYLKTGLDALASAAQAAGAASSEVPAD